MSTKDLLLGNDSGSAPSTGGAYVPPPIDSSLQGAHGATSTAPQQSAQPTATPAAPSGTDKSQQVTTPVSSVAASTLQPPPAMTDGNASKGFVPGQKMKGIGQILNDAMPIKTPDTPATNPEPASPSTPASDAEDDYDKKMQAYYDEYKAKRDKNLGDLMATMNKMADAYKQPTEEELEKERKKRKREQIFNAIGDGIQALSNLYFTTQYAPNSYDPKNSLSAKAQERYDKIDKEREADRDKYYNILANQYQLQNAADKDDLGWMKDLENLKANRAAAKAKAEAANAKAAAEQANDDRDYNLKKEKQEADAKRADERDAETRRHNRAQEAIGRQNAATSAARASGSASGGGGRGGSKEKYTIRLHDGSVKEYDKSRTGALSSLAPTMKSKALAASQRYAKAGDNVKARHYRELANQLSDKANTKETMAAIVAANAWDFPTMDADVRRMIGADGGFNAKSYKRQPAAKKSTTTTKPPLN